MQEYAGCAGVCAVLASGTSWVIVSRLSDSTARTDYAHYVTSVPAALLLRTAASDAKQLIAFNPHLHALR